MNEEIKKYYEVLGIKAEATDQEVYDACGFIANFFKDHTDMAPEDIRKINEAYKKIMAHRKAEEQQPVENAKSDATQKVTQEEHEQRGAEKISLENETKKCPFCAELIKLEAIKCRYCGERLDTNPTTDDSSRETARDGRFIAYHNGTVLDTRTNLMWAAKDNGRDINWANATSYCISYRGGGYTDWRMPTMDELAGLYDESKSRPGACDRSANIHVATELIYITCFGVWASEAIGSDADGISFHDGTQGLNPQSNDTYVRALPVRSGGAVPGKTIVVDEPPVKTTDVIEKSPQKSQNIRDLYEAILGEKNRIYYLAKFDEFDQQAPGLKATWNWPAFFFCGSWALYRKMYIWFFAFLGIWIISIIFEKAGFPVLGFLLLLGPWIAFTIFANSLYYGSVKKKIAVAQLSIRDGSRLREFLRHRGGVHTWVVWVCCLLFVTGIMAAISIPQFTAYKQRINNAAELERWNAPSATTEAPAPAYVEAPAPAPRAPAPISPEQEHFDRISRAHPDFEIYRDSGAIKAWIQNQPSYLRGSLLATYNKGDADSVIALLSKFKKDNNIPTK